ncbi:UNVERIFIED_CONTAM: hypothetical protein GTU68_055641 [Idotea baltica]|nr:hypothetical protein [Idotea baltica]
MTNNPFDLEDARARYETQLIQCWTGNEDGSHDIAHIRRVWRNAWTIAQGETVQIDLQVLLPAVIFHDLINLPKNAPDRHLASAQSAGKALSLLASEPLSPSQRDNIAHAITAHSYSAGLPARTVEARILQDADRLDALGAIGVARSMYIAGRLNTQFYHPDDPLAQTRELDDTAYTLDHFPVKLFKLKDMMNTKTGRDMAQTRTAYMEDFRAMILAEAGLT